MPHPWNAYVTVLATTLGEEGYVICSGLERGVDTATHAASLVQERLLHAQRWCRCGLPG